MHFTSHQPNRFGFVLFAASLIAMSAALPAAASPKHAAGPYDWQSFGHDNSHDSYVNDPAVSVSNAPGSGLRVMTNLLSAGSGGPAIAFNATTNSTLVFSGDRAGNVSAVQDGTGQAVWTTSLGPGASIVGTPLVSSDQSAVWVATAVSPALYELNAATGAVMCSVTSPLAFQASPTEGTASNGSLVVYVPTVASASQSGTLLAVNESTCTTQFNVSPYRTADSGSVASSAFGVDAGGRDLIIQGTSHPDSTVYAIDATTGAVDWSYVVDTTGATDVAAAATISPPGKNGFADGVAYIVAQNQICYALDLTTGAVIWQYNFGVNAGTKSGIGHSSAALDGNTLVLGMADGAYALNATTGARIWHYTDPAKVEAVSSPAIIGAPGSEVVALGDLSGAFHILSLQSGADLYDYQTGNYITASAADFNGDIVIASTDGFLYDFTPGGGNGSAPKTAWTAPAQGTNIPYASTVTITGTATDAAGVAAVQVAVQSGGPLGQWYDLTTNTWVNGALTNAVPVATPGATSTSWSFTVPVPSTHGAVFQVFANAVNVDKRADIRGVKVSFGVTGSTSSPSLKPSAVFVPPGTSFSAVASGFRPSEIVLFSANGKSLGTAFANSSGTATGTLKVPVNMPFGPTPLKASGASSGDIATAQIDFANSWLQNNDGALHHGFEPNDYVFAALRPPVVNSLLSEAWYYAAGAPVESSPAVSNGTVFFGNDAGTLTALSVDNPVPIWSYTIPTGAAIRSAPAVDQISGNTIVTADDGNVYIVNSATGAPVGKPILIGGLLTSPTLSNSRIFVGSDNGTVTCINETTGAVVWSHKVKGPVHSIPVVDWTMNMVAVGDDTGVVTAFLTGSGLQLWQFTTLGPVTVSPSVNNGSVYVGSADKHLWSINETTGVLQWSYSAGSVITTSPVLDPVANLLYAGLANGRLVAVNPANGVIAWSTFVGFPYVSSALTGIGAANNYVFSENTGGALAGFESSAAGKFELDFATGGALTSSPTVVDGAVYVGASSGGVFAFTPFGALPQRVPTALRQAAANAIVRAHAGQSPAGAPAAARRPFSWSARRDFALRADPLRPAAAVPSARTVNAAPHGYAIVWAPGGRGVNANYVAAVRTAFGSGLAGAALDASPYPGAMSDAAIQAEIAKTIALERWRPSPNAPVYVLTANGAIVAADGFCSYRSAFAPGGDRAHPIVYGVIPYLATAGACAPPGGYTPAGDPAIDTLAINLARTAREFALTP